MRRVGAIAAVLVIALARFANGKADSRLRSACKSGDVDKFLANLGAGADVNAGDKFGFTCLHLAARNGHDGIVVRALAAGANPSAATNEEAGYRALETPLHAAAIGGSLASAEELINAGAYVDAPMHVRGRRIAPHACRADAWRTTRHRMG